MISYFIISSLLSVIGYGFYRIFIQGRASFHQRKRFLHTILGLSLCLPLGWQMLGDPFPTLSSSASTPAFGMIGQIDPHALAQHCECQQPNYAHRIHYRADALLATLISYQDWLFNGLLLALGGVILLFVLQMGFLARLVKRSIHQPNYIDQSKVTLLTPSISLGAGAFWLGKAYVIWPKGLTDYDSEAQQAILHHEYSHVTQRNTLERLLLQLVQCVWFANPIFYLSKKELLLLNEYIADQAALSTGITPKAYARLLLDLQQPQANQWVSSFKGSSLKNRIQQLLANSPQETLGKYNGYLTLLIASYICLIPLLSPNVQQMVNSWHSYASAINHLEPDQQEGFICTDCGTVCRPEEEFLYPNPTLNFSEPASPTQN